MNRRKFISSAALAAAAFTILPRHVLGGNGFLAPSDRINLGYIGVGKQVGTLLNGLMGLPETMIMAAADVDSTKLNAVSSFGKELDSFADIVTFGIAPAILTYQLVLTQLG